jgi:polyhydroxyalkanoate synthesis repressor PhaR
MHLIKKYSNRRLYDTVDSRYITLDELAERIRIGHEVRVRDANTDEDLTQATLAQVIFEGRGGGRYLPVSLLTQLIRLGDDALADFFGRWVNFALEAYLSARQSAQAAASLNPLTALLAGSNPLARVWSGWTEPARPAPSAPWVEPPPAARRPPPRARRPPHARPASPTATPPPEASASDVADLRREIAELKRSLRKPSRRAPKK